MIFRPTRLLPTLGLSFALAAAAPAQQRINVLTLDDTTIATQDSGDFANENLLRDGDASTASKIELKAGQPIDIVYQFGDEITTIEKLSITTQQVAKGDAHIEILASTLSSTTGFHSLRVEPLNASRNGQPQRFSFEPSAAKWALIRIVPLDDEKPLQFSIAELELTGYAGPPKSTYSFDESPADAIKVLSGLSDSIKVELTPDEKRLFADAKDGKLDEIGFAEASLLSSGVTDSNQRKKLLAQIDQFESQCKEAISADLPPFERGKKLLAWLHAGPLGNGYVENQTDVSTALKKQTFNCVSSATLYNILARRLGLDARGIEVPDHAFSILYDGTKHADVETTTRHGFNPARNRQALERFQQTTGFVYIPDRNRSRRREIGDTGMVALTYYNHGVAAMKDDRHGDAMIAFFKALSLDDTNKSAVKNILAALGSWSRNLYEDGKMEQALAILEVGRELAPKDRGLKHEQKFIWQRYIQKLVELGKAGAALEKLVKAYERTQEDQLAELQSWVFVLNGQQLVKAKKWEAALANANEGLKIVGEHSRKDLSDWKLSILFSWSTELADARQFSAAINVVEIGLKENSDWRLSQRLAFLAQEWSRKEADEKDIDAGLTVIESLIERFPESHQLEQVASSLTSRTAKSFLNKKDFASAIKLYQTAKKRAPKNWRLKQNEEAVWMMWARPHLDAREWEEAAEIYAQARKSMPQAFAFQKNLAYITQELGKDTSEKNGVVAGEKAIAKMAERFPNISGIQQMRGSLIHREVNRLVKKEQFDEAHTLLAEQQDLWRYEHEFRKAVAYVFYQQAKPSLDAKDWAKAVRIFEKGYKSFPKNSKVKDNLEFAWLSCGQPLIDDKKWDEAIALYGEALASLPSSSKLKRKLSYCKQQRDDAK